MKSTRFIAPALLLLVLWSLTPPAEKARAYTVGFGSGFGRGSSTLMAAR
jgi:hypothetical protein